MGATSNRRIGIESRAGLDGPLYLISACVSDSTGPHHAFADFCTPVADFADLAPYVARYKAMMELIAGGVTGEDFQAAFVALWGSTVLADLQALDGEDESRPHTSAIFALLGERAAHGMMTP